MPLWQAEQTMGILKDGKDKGFILKNKLDLRRTQEHGAVILG